MLIGVTFLVVLWVGGQQVLAGRISIGSFVMFNTYMGMLVWPMIALGWVVNLMQRGSASLEPHQPDPARTAVHSPRRRDARAAGTGARRDRIPRRDGGLRQRARRSTGIDLRIPAGATVAVVGHTGSRQEHAGAAWFRA